jgi:zinc transport system substrate-binding protein
VTSHDAFGYLAAAYDLDERSVSGLSPDAEPDARKLGELGVALLNPFEGLTAGEQRAGDDYVSVMRSNCARSARLSGALDRAMHLSG